MSEKFYLFLLCLVLYAMIAPMAAFATSTLGPTGAGAIESALNKLVSIDRNNATGPEVSDEAKIMLDVEAVLDTVYLDIPYHTDHPLQKMDILLPNIGNAPYPLVVYIHGGGWFFGDKRNIHTRSALKMVHAGYAVASINYRLSGETKWPNQIYDCKAAIRFLRANGHKYGLDTAKIAVWGNSAGGHLAAMLATTAGMSEFEDLGMGNAECSSVVDLAVIWFGGLVVGSPAGKYDPIISQLFGFDNDDSNPVVRQASPINHIKSSLPPMLLQHGTSDTAVSCTQARDFYNRYVEACGTENITLDLFEGVTHSGDIFHTEGNLRRVVNFLDHYMLAKKRGVPPVFHEYTEIR